MEEIAFGFVRIHERGQQDEKDYDCDDETSFQYPSASVSLTFW